MNTVNGSIGCTPNELVFGGFCGSEDDLFVNKSPKISEMTGAMFAIDLEREQAELFSRAEAHQAKELQRIASRAVDSSEKYSPSIGDWVLAARGGMPHGRPRDKLQLPLTGPWRVLEPSNPASALVECLHAASRQVVRFGLHELLPFNSELLDAPEDYEKVAQRDFWDYSVDCIVDHRPHLPRRAPGKRVRPKSGYEFLVRYKYIPLSIEEGSENPSWQPWSYTRHLTALRDYCSLPVVTTDLGRDFYVEAVGGTLDE
jgi:hypothetical protein